VKSYAKKVKHVVKSVNTEGRDGGREEGREEGDGGRWMEMGAQSVSGSEALSKTSCVHCILPLSPSLPPSLPILSPSFPPSLPPSPPRQNIRRTQTTRHRVGKSPVARHIELVLLPALLPALPHRRRRERVQDDQVVQRPQALRLEEGGRQGVHPADVEGFASTAGAELPGEGEVEDVDAFSAWGREGGREEREESEGERVGMGWVKQRGSP